jgi:hypothetical protein
MLTDEDESPRYVGRTIRPVEVRVKAHQYARRAQWLKACNAPLAAWLQDTTPSVKVLAEVPEDADPWPFEKQWIIALAHPGLLNKRGNPLACNKLRDGPLSAVAA